LHQVHHHLIRHSHQNPVPEVVVRQFAYGPIGKPFQRLLHCGLILGRRFNQQIDVLRGAHKAVLDDGKSTDHDIASAELVQARADLDQILYRGWPGVGRVSMLIVHASFSS
jgi:hypothetical protein